MRHCLHLLVFCILVNYPFAIHAQQKTNLEKADSLLTYANRERLNDIGAAITAIEQALVLAHTYDLGVITCRAYNQLGNIYLNVGFYTKSLEEFHKALTVSQEKQWPDLQAETLTNIGNVYFYEDSLSTALSHYKQAISICKKTGNSTTEARALSNIGLIHNRLGDYAKSEQYLRMGLKLNREQNNYEASSINLANLADLYHLQDMLDSARLYYQEALVIADQHQFVRGRTLVYMGMGNVYKKQRKLTAARESLLKALTLSRQISANNATKDILSRLSEIAIETENYRQAYAIQYQYSRLSDSLSALAQRSEHQHYYNLLEAERNINENRLLKANVAARELELQASLANHQKQFAFTLASIIAVLLLVVIMAIFLYHYRQNKRNHDSLQHMHAAIQAQAKELEEAYDKIRQHNIQLEGNIEERTRQLNQQNRQLIQYAFFNAHKVRGPLARILGLVNLLPKAAHQTEFQFILDRLNESANELDKVVHEINLILESKPVSQDNYN